MGELTGRSEIPIHLEDALKCFAFDRDGTLIWGEGPITKRQLVKLRGMGYHIGGSGGQHPDEQYRDWRENNIEPDFAVNKIHLASLRASLRAKYEEVTHVGDTPMDVAYAQAAGVSYMTPTEGVKRVKWTSFLKGILGAVVNVRSKERFEATGEKISAKSGGSYGGKI